MDQIERVLHEIEQRRHFLVTSHARPDGDAIGSALAMAQILRRMGKSSDVVMGDSVPVIYRVLPYADSIVHASHVNGNCDAAIILECDSIQRTRLQGLEHCFLINIDHHITARQFAHVNWIDPSAVATAELVFRLSQAAGVKLTPEIATCLYTALLTDTGSFCYAGTSACTFELAKYLVEHGADPGKIAQSVYFSSPTSKMRLLGAALTHLQRDGAVTWMYVSRHDMERCGALDEDCEGLVNYALGIAGVEVAVFFRELSNERIRVSIRSKGAVNVAQIAEKFGGGGHECAGGFSTAGPVQAAAELVLAELRGKIPETSI
jgi:phosphoesterase RecJ-like protein